MRTYSKGSWKRLGIWVHDARLQAGFSDIEEWAVAAKRSTRQLQGLERGESVGAGTIKVVAEALGVDSAILFAMLVDSDGLETVWREPGEDGPVDYAYPRGVRLVLHHRNRRPALPSDPADYREAVQELMEDSPDELAHLFTVASQMFGQQAKGGEGHDGSAANTAAGKTQKDYEQVARKSSTRPRKPTT